MKRIVAICGYKGSGKDFLGNFLAETYGYNKLSFAGNLKEGVRVMFDLTKEHVDGDLKDVVLEDYGITPRQILQHFGTEVAQYQLAQLPGSTTGRNIWARNLVNKIMGDSRTNFVITDMRFQHEYRELKDAFGSSFISVRVERDSVLKTDSHVSEKDFNDIPVDITVKNNRDENYAFEQLRSFFDLIHGFSR